MDIDCEYSRQYQARQNRRRMRPGSRRRAVARKSNLQVDYSEGLLDAMDNNVALPSDKSRPSPLLRQNFDQSWQRWKARQAEEEALIEVVKLQSSLELDQQRMFGGDVDDDELYRLGILYNEHGASLDASGSSDVASSIPSGLDYLRPLPKLRQSKIRRSRRMKWTSIPLTLSLSNLRDDVDIAKYLSLQRSCNITPTIQHREISAPSISLDDTTITTDIPLSLPTTSASGSPSSAHGSNFLSQHNDTLSFPQHSLDSGDWIFIDTTPPTPTLASPATEPETWIILSDDS